MSLLEWKDEFSVGVKELDLHHQKIFDLINGLHEIMRNLKDREFIIPMIDELRDYAEYHFQTEEKLFTDYNYADSKNHIESHNIYREKIKGFTDRQNENFLSFELIDFLEDWWLSHVTGTDQLYKDFFKQNNLK